MLPHQPANTRVPFVYSFQFVRLFIHLLMGTVPARMNWKVYMKNKGQFKKGNIPYNQSHCLSGTHFYRKYFMASRHCSCESVVDWENYGGRGIKCLWSNFLSFKEDMYESYLDHVKKYGQKDTTLERINVDGNYCKENCRWATIKEQARNKRTSHPITWNGLTLTPIGWQEKTGIGKDTIMWRIKKGWTLTEIFTCPVQPQKHEIRK